MAPKKLFALISMVTLACAACSSPSEVPSLPPAAPVVLATTTSTYDTGLLDSLVPTFEAKSGLTVKTIAVGTGQALELGRRGEADVLLVHAPEKELSFVAAGYGKNRRAVMHNDFVIVGPRTDPAGLRGSHDASAALTLLAGSQTTWISRGDKSGTHTKELDLWKQAGMEPAGEWYVQTGQGMSSSLRVASERQGYTLSDRGTFVATENLDLEVLVEGDPQLLNPYHVIQVASASTNGPGGAALADFFVARETQAAIRDFKRQGHALFTPDALK